MSRTALIELHPRPGIDPESALQRVSSDFAGADTVIEEVIVNSERLLCRVRFDPLAGDSAGDLLRRHLDDERLWHSWIESLYRGGVCEVLSSAPEP